MSFLKIKICGITNEADAKLAASMGYDYIGMVFYEKSPRNVSLANSRKISHAVSGVVETVGVFVDEEDPSVISKTAAKAGLNLVQLHGTTETPEYCASLKNLLPPDVKIIRALRISNDNSSPSEIIETIKSYQAQGAADYFLLDTFSDEAAGGTGIPFDWNIASEIIKNLSDAKIFISGGLGPDNVREAVEKLSPWGVDASSRLERLPRRKDYDRMLAFIKEAKRL